MAGIKRAPYEWTEIASREGPTVHVREFGFRVLFARCIGNRVMDPDVADPDRNRIWIMDFAVCPVKPTQATSQGLRPPKS